MSSKATAIKFKQPHFLQTIEDSDAALKSGSNQLVLKKLWRVLPKPRAAAEMLFNVIFNARQIEWPHNTVFQLTNTLLIKKTKVREKAHCCSTVSKGRRKWDHIFFSVVVLFFTDTNICIERFVIFIVPSIGSEKAARKQIYAHR